MFSPHDEDLKQLWWYVKQVKEVLYIYTYVCAHARDYMEQTRTLSIASCIRYVTPSFLAPSIMIMTDESKNVNWYFFLSSNLKFSPSQIIYGYSSCYYNYLLQTSDASQGQWQFGLMAIPPLWHFSRKKIIFSW